MLRRIAHSRINLCVLRGRPGLRSAETRGIAA